MSIFFSILLFVANLPKDKDPTALSFVWIVFFLVMITCVDLLEVHSQSSKFF